MIYIMPKPIHKVVARHVTNYHIVPPEHVRPKHRTSCGVMHGRDNKNREFTNNLAINGLSQNGYGGYEVGILG